MTTENENLIALKDFLSKEKQKNPDTEHYFVIDKFGRWLVLTRSKADKEWSSFVSASLRSVSFKDGKVSRTRLVANCDYILCNPDKTYIKFKGKHHLYISLIEVYSEQDFNKGYGTILLRFLEKEALKYSLEEIRGLCVPMPPARPEYVKNFYKVNGFRFYKKKNNLCIIKPKLTFRKLNEIQKNGLSFLILNELVNTSEEVEEVQEF